MSVATSDKFLELVRRSELVDPQPLRDFVAGLTKEEHAESPERLAARLVEAKLLNNWQAENLLKGKYKGFTLGKYKLRGHLGTGGMSSVYLAEHPVMERLVAVKVLPKKYIENRNYLDRFRREARAAASLDHPNIVRAFDIDQDGDTHYIVMEYVDGQDLQKMVKEFGPLDPFDAADFIAQAANGLQHAHDAGLIHRDVKPANCLVDKKRVLKLLDLGLAKFSADSRPGLSEIYDDSVVGTADYLAPEQAINSQKIDWRADIYGLGCTFYFLLTGQPPFPTGSIAERLLKHQTAEPTSLYQLRPEVPPALAEICRRMMIKSPYDRLQRASQVAAELTAWLSARGRGVAGGGQGSGSWNAADTKGSRQGRSDSSRSLPRSNRPRPQIPANDTVSSQGSMTRRLAGGSGSRNEDLELAPLEEEHPTAPAATDSTASKSTGPSSGVIAKGGSVSGIGPVLKKSSGSGSASPNVPVGSDPPAAGGSTSGPPGTAAITREELAAFKSGPLDNLLKEDQLARSSQVPTIQLSVKRKEEGVDPHLILLITIIALFSVALLIFILATVMF